MAQPGPRSDKELPQPDLARTRGVEQILLASTHPGPLDKGIKQPPHSGRVLPRELTWERPHRHDMNNWRWRVLTELHEPLMENPLCAKPCARFW